MNTLLLIAGIVVGALIGSQYQFDKITRILTKISEEDEQ